jgi:hypothetical protein
VTQTMPLTEMPAASEAFPASAVPRHWLTRLGFRPRFGTFCSGSWCLRSLCLPWFGRRGLGWQRFATRSGRGRLPRVTEMLLTSVNPAERGSDGDTLPASDVADGEAFHEMRDQGVARLSGESDPAPA